MVGTLQYANPKNSGKSVFLNYLLRYQCREQCNVCKKLRTVFLDVFSGCHCHSTVQCHAAMAPHKVGRYTCNGTQQCHHVHCTLQWHPGATSNPPLLEVRTPMAIAIWGKCLSSLTRKALDYHQFILETPLVKHGASTTDVGSDNPTHSDCTPLLEAQPL